VKSSASRCGVWRVQGFEDGRARGDCETELDLREQSTTLMITKTTRARFSRKKPTTIQGSRARGSRDVTYAAGPCATRWGARDARIKTNDPRSDESDN